MGHILLALFFIGLLALLTVHLIYTFIAMAKGVPFVPTTHTRVAQMLDIATIIPGEKLLDLGSGDGRILFEGARRGATCVGVEINPLLCHYSRLLARIKGIKGISIEQRDFWSVDLSDIDVLTVYLIPFRLDQLKAKVHAEMKSGSRVVTGLYHFADWEPKQRDGDVALYQIP